MKLLLHIGMPKTGTTSLQRFLRSNRDQLLSEGFGTLDGVGFPSNVLFALIFSGKPPAKVATGLARSLHLEGLSVKEIRKAKSQLLGDVNRQLGKLPTSCKTVIISCEQLSQHLRNESEVSDLSSWIESQFDSVQVVSVIRNPVSRIPSSWTESVKAGQTMSLSDFTRRAELGLMNSQASFGSNPLAHLDLWSSVFDSGRLRVASIPENGGDTTKLFAESFLAGVGGLYFSPERSNASPSRSTVEAWRLANVLSPARDRNGRRRHQNLVLRNRFQRLVPKFGKPPILDERQRQQIVAAWNPVLARLESDYGMFTLGSQHV